MARDDGAGNIVLAFILGAVSGAAVALLYAPKTGSETREYLSEKARDARARAADAAAKSRDALNQGRETLTTAIERGRQAYQEARSTETREVTEVFLGVIAVATLAIAIAQIGVMVAAGRLARRVERLAEQIDREVKPLFGHLNAIGRDASRAAGLATAQMERADALFGDIVGRIELALNNIQSTIGAPAREGRALLSGFRAALQALRDLRQDGRARQSRSDDEDALFI